MGWRALVSTQAEDLEAVEAWWRADMVAGPDPDKFRIDLVVIACSKCSARVGVVTEFRTAPAAGDAPSVTARALNCGPVIFAGEGVGKKRIEYLKRLNPGRRIPGDREYAALLESGDTPATLPAHCDHHGRLSVNLSHLRGAVGDRRRARLGSAGKPVRARPIRAHEQSSY